MSRNANNSPPNPSRGTNCRDRSPIPRSRIDFEGNRTSAASKFSPGFFSRKNGEVERCNAFFPPPPSPSPLFPKNKKRGGQIFAVTPTPLVPSLVLHYYGGMLSYLGDFSPLAVLFPPASNTGAPADL